MGHCLLRALAIALALLIATGCSKLRNKHMDGVDSRLELLLGFDDYDFAKPMLHPDGGYLVSKDGKGKPSHILRLDEDGKEIWNSQIMGTDDVDIFAVGDDGRIYITSIDRMFEVLDGDGNPLWRREKVFGEMNDASVGTNGHPHLVTRNEGVILLDDTGGEIWQNLLETDGPWTGYAYRSDDGSMQLVMGWHRLDNSVASGKCEYTYREYDEQGKELWNYHYPGPGSGPGENPVYRDHSSHYPDKVRVMPDGRVLLRSGGKVYEFDRKGGIMELSYDGILVDLMFDNDVEAELTGDGNYLFTHANDPHMQTLVMFEMTPDLELIHDHRWNAGLVREKTGRDLPSDNSRLVGYYDSGNQLAYLFCEDDYATSQGAIYVFSLQGDLLDEYRFGKRTLEEFIPREDGRMLAHRRGGDLFLLPVIATAD